MVQYTATHTARARDDDGLNSSPEPRASRARNYTRLAQWRASCRAAIGYTGKIYDQPALNWTSTSYIQPQSHPYDRLFYDVASHSYTMDVFLADLTQRYGGIDSVLVWPTYTNIGMDDRNQFDLIRAMPGGAPPPAAAAAAACCRRPRARAHTPPPPPCG